MAVRTSTNQLEKHKGNRVVGCNQPGTQPLIKQHSFCIAALSATDGSGNKATASATMTMGKYERSIDLLAVCCSWVFTDADVVVGGGKIFLQG